MDVIQYKPNEKQVDCYARKDPKTGKFLPVEGKTKKILAMEKELGVDFEQDYKEQYLSGKLTNRLSQRDGKQERTRSLAIQCEETEEVGYRGLVYLV